MKITPTSASRATSRNSGKKSVSKAGFSPTAENGGNTAPAITATSPIASVEALIALQAEPETQTATEQATKRAGNLLGILDTIRIGLLDGGIPQSTLKRLLHALGEQRQETGNPQLEAILEQVEIRAQVELAKLEVSLSNQEILR